MKFDKGLIAGSSTLLILSLLQNEDMYGYQMIVELARRSNDTFQMKEGTLYPILYRLEDDGLIASSWFSGEGRAAPKKIYTATDAGRQENIRRQAVWQEFVRTVSNISEGVQSDGESN